MKLNYNVLERVRAVETKNGIFYAKKDGRLYKTLKILYSVFGIYTLGINLLYIVGILLTQYGTDNFKYYTNSLITVSACTVFLIAGYVLSFFRLNLTAGIMSVVPTVFLIPLFALNLKDDLGYMGFKASYYYRHLVPLVLMIIFMAWLTVVAVRAKSKTEKQYKKVLNNLYNQYNVNNSEGLADMSEEQWNQFLESYDPSDYKKLFKAQGTVAEDNNTED